MPQPNSKEQTIYRRMTGQIQLGFFDGAERFPSAQQIADRFQVSYCPAQRALKALEQDGLIRLCRGKATTVLKKPYADYLASPVFLRRKEALQDLFQALGLLSPAVTLYHLRQGDAAVYPMPETRVPVRRLYQLFHQSLQSLNNRTAMSLYYDIGTFMGSAFSDILTALSGQQEADRITRQMAADLQQARDDYRRNQCRAAQERLAALEASFYEKVEPYFCGSSPACPQEQEAFTWEPHKGRTRYCDIIAVDLLRKINQGEYPVGSLLPHGAALAAMYHVSPITIRRTIRLLNQLGATCTRNGVGTCVQAVADAATLARLKDLGIDGSLQTFVETLQLLAITSQPVLLFSYPHFSAETRAAIAQALDAPASHASMVALLSACLQAVVRHCPLAAIREIYGKLTLLLLNGSVLQFSASGREPVPHWASISASLFAALQADDGAAFASAFHTLAEDTHALLKQKLQALGITAAPVPWLPLQ